MKFVLFLQVDFTILELIAWTNLPYNRQLVSILVIIHICIHQNKTCSLTAENVEITKLKLY